MLVDDGLILFGSGWFVSLFVLFEIVFYLFSVFNWCLLVWLSYVLDACWFNWLFGLFDYYCLLVGCVYCLLLMIC